MRLTLLARSWTAQDRHSLPWRQATESADTSANLKYPIISAPFRRQPHRSPALRLTAPEARCQLKALVGISLSPSIEDEKALRSLPALENRDAGCKSSSKLSWLHRAPTGAPSHHQDLESSVRPPRLAARKADLVGSVLQRSAGRVVCSLSFSAWSVARGLRISGTVLQSVPDNDVAVRPHRIEQPSSPLRRQDVEVLEDGVSTACAARYVQVPRMHPDLLCRLPPLRLKEDAIQRLPCCKACAPLRGASRREDVAKRGRRTRTTKPQRADIRSQIRCAPVPSPACGAAAAERLRKTTGLGMQPC